MNRECNILLASTFIREKEEHKQLAKGGPSRIVCFVLSSSRFFEFMKNFLIILKPCEPRVSLVNVVELLNPDFVWISKFHKERYS